MPKYNAGFRSRMVQRMAGPEGISARALAKEVGVPQPTLSLWLRRAPRVSAMTKDRDDQDKLKNRRPKAWTPDEKLRVVLQASALSEEQLGAFLRREGLQSADLNEWRAKALEAASAALQSPASKRRGPTPEVIRIRELEKELHRKDRALAEVTALLALKKKLQALWGDEEDDTSTKSET
jgi:transposase